MQWTDIEEKNKEVSGPESAMSETTVLESSKGYWRIPAERWLINQSAGKWWHSDIKIIQDGLIKGLIAKQCQDIAKKHEGSCCTPGESCYLSRLQVMKRNSGYPNIEYRVIQ